MATNVKYDFVEHGYGLANMIVDPVDWAVIGAVNKRGIWRVAYGEPPHLSEKELLERLPEKYERLLPGPRPLKYEIVSANPYWAHQRTAATYRDGRVVLCGDAAHVSVPPSEIPLQIKASFSSSINFFLYPFFESDCLSFCPFHYLSFCAFYAFLISISFFTVKQSNRWTRPNNRSPRRRNPRKLSNSCPNKKRTRHPPNKIRRNSSQGVAYRHGPRINGL